MRDPRDCQIAVLGSLVLWTGWRHDFSPPAASVMATLTTVLAVQWLCGRLCRLPAFDPRSPLISGLSLCLLLRTPSITWAVFAAVLTIGLKFLVRIDGRHVWNPSNVAVVTMMAIGKGWASPGLWGTDVLFALALGGAGIWVVTRAARADVTLAFLATWSALLLGRAWLLGDPLSLPLHQLRSGALVLFAFFMISDPKTTPRSRGGRLAFAVGVAVLAAGIEFRLYRPHGFLWALAACSPLVPILGRVQRKGAFHVPHPASDLPGPSLLRHRRAGLLRLLRLPGRHPALQPELPRRPRPS